ncbi:DUF488 domain-containing protein [Agromyces kandeliae]|uniref:DUF488 family protein n=1 Tax=Agromyces kandeliae TaxID=2666141 RepID=A0A6L5QZP4_9MICO|nr:DUF488 family protein [Agromyces kandeliae]MRX42668.1 DUF488 family protein [Agromyces kandeliae]
MAIVIKRVHDAPDASDGVRILVDRLWPRGISKERAELDDWAKDAAPSPGLRTEWHRADADRFDEFAARYRVELDANAAAQALLGVAHEHDRVTLVYGARDAVHNHAAVLRDWLGEHGADVER